MTMDFQQGHAVVIRRYHGDVLGSFHDSTEDAMRAANRTIELDSMRIAAAEVAYGTSGNVRMWRMTDKLSSRKAGAK